MRIAERPDVVGGALLALTGAGVTLFSLSSYEFGTLRAVGSGMFPVSLGIILLGLGTIIAIAGRNGSGGSGETPDLMSFLIILASLAAFIFVTQLFGMIPGIMALVVVSSLAVNKLGLVGQLLLGLFMVIVSVVIFSYVFALQLPLLSWPL